jgi:hypothetical protein
MVADVYWLVSESAPKLRDVCNGRVIQCPKHVFVEGRGPLLQSNFDVVRKQIVLSNEIFFLNLRVKFGVVFLQNQHQKSPG